MSELQCILCRGKNISMLEHLNTHQIARLYQTRARVDVKKFFKAESLLLLHCNDCDLKFYSPLVSGDSRFYDELQEYNNYYLETKAEYVEAAKYIATSDEVLEIGCGEGAFRNFINCHTYTGLEFSDAAVKKASVKGLYILKQPIEDFAVLNKEKFDIVCCFQVLEHAENPEKFIKHSIACLKPGGKFVIAVPSEDSFINQAINFYLNMPPHHVSRWTDRSLSNIAILYDLKLHSLIHEPLQSFHKLFYLKTIITKQLFKFWGHPAKSIDPGFLGKLLYGCATLLAHILSPFFTKFQNIRGQSVIVVYTK